MDLPKWYQLYSKLTKVIYDIMNAICVLCLATELVSVLTMVVGRYVFNKVPSWCDQLSLLALVWMVVLSIALAIYHESHMRVELVDAFASKKVITVLKYLANIAGIIFSALMVWHGFVLVDLVKVAKIAGLKISQSYLYLPLIICGLVSVYMSIFCIVRRVVEGGK
ncbi:MAG: TRAP transporter small permease [Clostridia bacterium]|nr:TRAP transporter small permease [Clostridia bacterium]